MQLYIQDVEAGVDRPLKELKRFFKVKLDPDEKKNIVFEIETSDFAFYDEAEERWRVEKGKFNILVGSSSRDIRLRGEIESIG